MLISVVIKLAVEKPATVPTDLGRATHAWFMTQVQRADPALAQRLHEPNAPRPFTVSMLRGTGPGSQGQVVLRPEQVYWLRVTSFKPELSQRLTEDVMPNLPDQIDLAETAFTLKGATCDPQEHPWAGQTTFETLAQEHLLGTREPDRKLTLRFASPTTFRRTKGETSLTDDQGRAYRVAGHNVALPLPGLVFDSYLQRWNTFAPLALHPDVKRYAQECVAISRYRLRTVLVEFGAARHVGFVGSCQFMALVHDPYWLRLLNLLAAFAFYAGTGHQTTRGLGQTRRIGESASRRVSESASQRISESGNCAGHITTNPRIYRMEFGRIRLIPQIRCHTRTVSISRLGV
jgi:CRISPR-associated endoribonuclease Cas6